MYGDALLIQVIRGRLRNESINAHVLLPKRKSIDRKSQDLLGRKNELQGRKRIKALFLVDVVRPRQTTNRGLFHVVLENFREEHFVAQQWSPKVNARCRLGNADHRAVLAKNGGHKILYIEIPFLLGRFSFDSCQSARETSKSRVIGRFVHRERL